MGKTSKDPVKYIVSFRVNAEERSYLERRARELGLSVSRLLRQWSLAGSPLALPGEGAGGGRRLHTQSRSRRRSGW